MGVEVHPTALVAKGAELAEGESLGGVLRFVLALKHGGQARVQILEPLTLAHEPLPLLTTRVRGG